MSDHHGPASKMPFKWHFDDRQIMAYFYTTFINTQDLLHNQYINLCPCPSQLVANFAQNPIDGALANGVDQDAMLQDAALYQDP